MKKMLAAGLMILVSASLLAFKKAEKYYADIFQQLGIPEREARNQITSNFRYGSLSIPYSKTIKTLASGSRASAVKEIGEYIKKHVSSPEYIAAFKREREESKPQPPENADEYIKRRIEETKQDIASTEESMKKASGDMKKLFEATLKMQKDQLKILSNPNDPSFILYGGKTKEMQQEEMDRYQQDLKEYEQNFPADPKILTRTRLKQFLEMTADINFDAKLVSDGRGKMKFADPALERKDNQWKMCFRSGKETITAARAFAQQWLSELK